MPVPTKKGSGMGILDKITGRAEKAEEVADLERKT
jgi:hypothetical protein